MSNVRTISLFRQLSRQILPRVMAALLVLGCTLLFSYMYFTQSQAKQQQQEFIQALENDLQKNLTSYVRAVENLATNDLLINAVIDRQMRNEYLPLFLQGLKIKNEALLQSAMFDFAGNIMLSRNWHDVSELDRSYDWKSRVFEVGETFTHFDTNGLVVVAPILIDERPEGAFAINIASLDALVDYQQAQSYQLIFAPDNSLVYSNYATQPNNLPNTLPAVKEYFDGHVLASHDYGEYKIISISANSATIINRWFIAIATMVFCITIGFSLLSARIAARVAATTLRELHQELSHNIGTGSVKTSESRESTEISDIRQDFNTLINTTLDLSLKNERTNNVINSLQEFIIVQNSSNEVILKNRLAEQFFDTYKINVATIISMLIQAQANGHSHIEQEIDGRTVIWRMHSMQDSLNHDVGTIIVGEDVTQQRQLEQQLRLRNSAIEVTSSAFVISDVSLDDQPIVYANHAFCELTGYSKDEILGRNCKFLQGTLTEQDALIQIRSAISQKESVEVTLTNYKKDGTEFINQLLLSPIPDQNGEVKYYIGTQQDVTIQRQTAKYLADAKERAENFAKIQSRFFASMNHELRTPINGISGMLQALKQSDLNTKQRRFIELAERSADNLLLIVNDILEYSKAESGKIKLDSSRFNLYELILDIAENYRLQCQAKNIKFDYYSTIEPNTYVMSDRLRLQQILLNLLNNALKFTDRGSVIFNNQLEINSDNSYRYTCTVIDTGIGIEEQYHEKIFDAFSQASSTTSRIFGGTGLGLSICKQLTQLMHGDISLQSSPNQGSTFTFWVTLPPATNQSVDLVKPLEQVMSSQIQDSIEPPRVLIAEDNEINQTVILEMLRDMRTIMVPNGLQALHVLSKSKQPFDVVLMDNEMPEMDGVTATQLIRQGDAGSDSSDIPIIAVTAHAMEEDKARFMQSGFSDYLSKPINSETLRSRVFYWTAIRRGLETLDSQTLPE